MTTGETQTLVKRIEQLPTAAEIRTMVSDYVFGLAGPRKDRA